MTVSEATAHPAPLMPSFLDELTPKAILKFSKTFPFPFEDIKTRRATTQQIALEVSAFLGIWLSPGPGCTDLHTDKVQASLATRNTFVCGPAEFSDAGITEEQSTAFQSRVSARIRQFLSEESHIGKPLKFCTGYSAREDLLELLTKSGIRSPPGSLIFPRKTRISIEPIVPQLAPINNVCVSIDFTAPPPLQPGELKRSIFDPDLKLWFKRVVSFKYKERGATLARVAEEVTDFLATFLEEEAHNPETHALLRAKGTHICDAEKYQEYKMTPEKIAAFKASVRSQIEGYKGCTDRINFRIDVAPENQLKDALLNAEIFPIVAYNLFPHCSQVKIIEAKITAEMGEFSISINFPDF